MDVLLFWNGLKMGEKVIQLNPAVRKENERSTYRVSALYYVLQSSVDKLAKAHSGTDWKLVIK